MIEGRRGDDTLVGGPGGRDMASFEASTAAIEVSRRIASARDTRGAGIDRLSGFEDLRGGRGADRLFGDDKADRIEGGPADDLLDGDRGRDTLTGGPRRDTFFFDQLSDSSPAQSGTIADFRRGDRIELDVIDADAARAGDRDFGFIGAASDVRYAGGVADADVNGDRAADLGIVVAGAAPLTRADLEF